MNIRTALLAVGRDLCALRRHVRTFSQQPRGKICTGRIEPLEPRIVLAVNLVSGTIPNGSIWAAGDIQRITGDAQLPAGATLTIQPGAIIKFDVFAGLDIVFDGIVNAPGTAGQPIVFTSMRDDTAGGDTNGDGAGTSPNNGDWSSIKFGSTSTGTLSNVEVRFGGAGPLGGAAVIESSNVSFTNSIFRNSITSGVRINASNPTLTASNFANNVAGSAVSMDLVSNPAITGVTVTNNAVNGLTIDGGTLTGSRFWNDPDIVYRLAGDVTVAPGATLTLAPGQVVKVPVFAGLDLTVNGTLLADGTPAQPIIFTSERDDTVGGDTNNNAGGNGPNNGDWNSIAFGSGSTGNIMDHVEARFGGAGPLGGAIVVNSAELTLTDSMIRNSSTNGARIIASNPTMTANSFLNNVFGSAVSMDLASNPAISGVTVANNLVNGLTLDTGTITGSRFWDDPDIVYRLGNDVTVDPGATLTIAPGQIVKVPVFAGIALTVNGTLVADGTPAQPIIFTSERDDTAGGDTNNNANGNVPNFGDWNSVTFGNGSTGNIMDNVEVRFGGAVGAAAVIVDNAVLTLTNSIVRNSSTSGLRVIGSNPAVTANSFLNNVFGSAVTMDLASNPAITGVTVSNNAVNGLTLDGGTLTGSRFWNDPDIVYRLAGDVTVAAGATLTLAPGQVVKVPVFAGIDLTVNGTLLADGTPAQPIIFTSERDDTAGGDTNNNSNGNAPNNSDWNSVAFGSGSAGNIMDNVEVRFGGAGPLSAAVAVNSAELTLTHSVIQNSGSNGVRIIASNPTLTANSFLNNVAGAAVSMDLASNPIITGVTVANNAVNGLTLDGGTLTGSRFWDDPDIVYRLAGDVTVAAAATLTIAPGQSVKVPVFAGIDLTVNGTLLADGTPAQPIIFTSERDDTVGGDTNSNANGNGPNFGDWNNITFGSGSTGNVMDFVEVRYGGAAGGGAVIINNAALTLTHSVIRNSGSNGVRIVGSNPTLTGNNYLNNVFGSAVSMDLASNPAISGVIVMNNAVNGLALDSGTLSGAAAWDDPEIVYRLSGDVTVDNGATLTIAPGMVVKARTFNGDDLIVGGTLIADGTSAQPIIFTCDRDDTAGGDTNNNGDANGPGNGHWPGLTFLAGGTGNVIDHAEVRYAGASAAGSAVALSGATVTVTNSVVRNSSTNALVARNGANLTATNNLIQGNSDTGVRAESASAIVAFNNTIDGNFRGVSADGAGTAVTITNNLISNNANAGVFVSGGGSIAAISNDVFNTTNYSGLANQAGTNGNISADPKYFNRANGQFQLRAGSPAIDSATSTGAPATDRLGNARFDDPNVLNLGGGAQPFFDMGAFERQEISTADVDLRAITVSGPATGLQGQQVTVSWSVDNLGPAAALGSWFDAVYLSTDAIFTPDDILLGDALHTGDLAPGAGYSNSKQVTLPGVLPGDYQFIVRTNSRSEVFEALELLNNAVASTNPIAMDLPALTIGAPLAGQPLALTGQSLFYKINVPAGADLVVNLDGPNGATNELYLKFGALPSRQFFDERGVRANLPDQSVTVADTLAGTYFVEVFAVNLSAPETFSLNATLTGFSIGGVSPARGSNTGEVTISIRGAQFDGNSQPRLVDAGNQTILPTNVVFTDSGLISATFDITGRSLGAADVQVVNTGNVVTTLPDSFNIVAGSAGRLVTNLIAPSRVRVGRDFTVFVELSNVGDTDVLAPVMELAGLGFSTLSFSPDLTNPASSLGLLGANDEGPAGVLPPGAKVRIPIYGRATTNGDEHFTLSIADYPATPIDYTALEPLIRPPGLTDAEWDPIFAQLQTQIGTQWSGYTHRLADDATLLPAVRGLNYSLADVFGLELDQARAALSTSVSGHLFLGDAARPLGNAHLELFDVTTGKAFSANSLNDGSFLLPVVPAGSYVPRLDGFVPANAAPTVVGASDVNGVNLIVNPAAALSGAVLISPGGAPVTNATVIATNSAGEIFSTTTDRSGRYTIGSLPAGEYAVKAGGGPFTEATFTIGNVTAGQQREHINLVLTPAGTITGTVMGPGGPLLDAVVTAVGADGVGAAAQTNAQGGYTLTGLKPQSYTLIASSDGLATAQLPSVNLATTGTLPDVDFNLNVGGGVSGKITAAVGGAALPFVLVTLENGLTHFSMQADQNGDYKSLDLPAGNYTITASAGPFMTTSGLVNVSAGGLATLNLALPPLGTISGTVTNLANNQPLANVVVHAIDAEGTIFDDVTDAAGNYAIPGLDSGSYRVVLGDPGTPGIKSSTASLSAGATSADVDFGVAVSGFITGTVFAANGTTAITDAIVTLSENGHAIVSHSVEADGTYSFVIVADGTYQVEAMDDGVAFPVISGLSVSGGVSLGGRNFIAGTHAISGMILDGSNSQPITGAEIFIQRTDGNAVSRAIGDVVSTTGGNFVVTGLVDGTYRVVVRAPDFATVVQDVVISGNNPAPLTLNLGADAELSGTLRDDVTSVTLAGGTLQAINQANVAINFEIVADATGHYALTGMPAGTYQIVALAGAHETVVRSVVVATGVNVVDVTLRAATTMVTGSVGNGSQSLPDVLVAAVGASGLVLGTAFTAADGTFNLAGLPAGGYSLIASASDHRAATPLAINLTNGQTLSGNNFTLTPAAIADPSGGIGRVLADAAGGVAGWLRSVLISVERSPRQPTSADLVGQLDLVNCPDESRDAVRAVANVERKFRDWQFVQENLDGITGTARELGFAGLKIANAAGKIILVVKSAAANLALAGATKTQQLLVEFVLPLANDLANVRNALDSANRGETLDIPGAAGLLNDANNKVTSLRTKLLEIKEAAIKSAQNARNSLGNLALQDIDRVKNVLGHLAKAIGIIDAGLAAADAINQSLDAYSRFTEQFAQFQNAREVYITAVGRANAAITLLNECKEYYRHNPNPIPPPDTHVVSTTPTTQIRSSFDPNDKHGPIGVGAGGFIQPGAMPFEIEFENDPVFAQIAAQVVQVTDTLDADLDLTTFEFGTFGFGGRVFTVPAGLTHYETTIDLRPENFALLVPVVLDLNTNTRVMSVTFSTLDPLTMLAPEGFEGFLPVNTANHDGEGFFTYIVQPKNGLATGTMITNQADIKFDNNAVIPTPMTTNTIDVDAPTSSIAALPATTTQRDFQITWSGNDGAGAGALTFDVFVSDNGRPFETFLTNTAATSTMFTGQRDHTYGFYTVARDGVGLAEAAPATADATIAVIKPPLLTAPGNKITLTDDDGDVYTVKLAGPGTLKYLQLGADADQKGPLDTILAENTKATSELTVSVVKKPGGDGFVTIGDIIGTGKLGSFRAPKSDLVANGFDYSGAVGFVNVRDVLQPDPAATPQIKIGGTAAEKTKIIARDVADEVSIESTASISLLKATSIGETTISAPKISKLVTTGGGIGADVTTTGTIGVVTIAGGALSGDFTARNFGDVTISGGDFSGSLTSLTSAATLRKTRALESLEITSGDFAGHLRLLGAAGPISVLNFADLGGNFHDATIVASKIASLLVAKNVTNSTILAGADLGADFALGGGNDTFGAGRIGTVTIKGDMTASVIAAGLNPIDGVLHNGDAIIGGIASKIAALTIRGSASDDSYFAAGKFVPPVKIASARINPPTDRRFFVG